MAAPKFSDLNPKLSTEALNSLESFGFKQTTPVQAATIPLFLSHKDVCVQATTGSGKTLAFGIPLFDILNRRNEILKKYEIGGLVIAPTRELATQIYNIFCNISKFYNNLTCALFVGGTDINDTYSQLEQNGAQIVIGTPGRVLDIFNRNTFITLKQLEVLVLDEADTLLDMGFRQSINQILSMLPKQRRTGLFSATQTQELRELAIAGMRNPVTIAVTIKNPPINNLSTSSSNSTSDEVVAPSLRNIPTSLHSYYKIAPYHQRLKFLSEFFWKYPSKKIIVFVSTCSCVDYYVAALNKLKHSEANQTNQFIPNNLLIVGLHGKMIPKKRNGFYQKFTSINTTNDNVNGESGSVGSDGAVMFSTDVAARGIDIPDVDWIIQLTAPKDPSFFIHRIGRTARAGREGNALIFVTEEEQSYIELLRGRGVPMNEMEEELNSQSFNENNEDENDENKEETTNSTINNDRNILTAIRSLCLHDRDLLELGTTAFISFLRAYKENLCTYIFRMDQLNIGNVATSYSLIKLPKISETVKYRGKIEFEELKDVNTSLIPYQHKEKEAARLRKLNQLKESQNQINEEQSNNNNNSNSNSNTTTERVNENERKRKELQAKKKEAETEQLQRKRKKKEGLHSKIMSEWDELAAEETLYKKLRKGKISKEVYDKNFSDDKVLEIEDVISLGLPKKKAKKNIDSDDDDNDDISDDSDNENDEDDDDSDSENKNERETKSNNKTTNNQSNNSKNKNKFQMKKEMFLLKQQKEKERLERYAGGIKQPKRQQHMNHKKVNKKSNHSENHSRNVKRRK